MTKTYDTSAGPIHAVNSVSLSVEKGEFVSILGPSGCGKSTLLMMMAGLESVSGGTIKIDSEDISAPRKDFGLVFQDATLLPWLSAEDNVLFPIQMMRLDKEDYRERAQNLLRHVGLGEFMRNRPGAMSGGMRQRVALCRSLIHDPTKLFMDEPFSALDAITRDNMGRVLLNLWDEEQESRPRIAVFVTHSIREAVLLSDRVIVMGRRPSSVKVEIAIPFERPRSAKIQETSRFNEIVAQIRDYIDETI